MLNQKASLRPLGPEPAFEGYDVQRLWYALLIRPWSCLGVVALHRTPNAWRLARSLAELAGRHRRRQIEAIDGIGLDLERAAAIASRVASAETVPRVGEPRFVIAVDSPVVNPSVLEVLAACDTAVLLVQMGVTDIPRARKTVEIVGRNRLAGAVLAFD